MAIDSCRPRLIAHADMDCFDGSQRQFRLEAILDGVRAKYGRGALVRAEDLTHKKGLRLSPNLDLLAEDYGE